MTLPAHLRVHQPHMWLLVELRLTVLLVLELVLLGIHLLIRCEIPSRHLLWSKVIEGLLEVEVDWSWSWQGLACHLRRRRRLDG